MLLLLIKYVVAIKDTDINRIDKCNFILSDLFNIYNSIKENNNSLISSILKDMLFKLKKWGVDFSKDEDFEKLQLSKEQENKIQDFIEMPDRDLFIIRENKLQKINIKTGSKYMSNLRSSPGPLLLNRKFHSIIYLIIFIKFFIKV